MSPIEEDEIYHYFFPTTFSPLILSISEDPTTHGSFNSFGGYASLTISRYISDYIGHNLTNARLPSVIYGLISLFLFYVIVNRWFYWKVALFSTFLLATNHYFLLYQHLLEIHMVTFTTIIFCVERFQNLLIKNNKLSVLSFAFACALTTLHYWTARWCMLTILLFYLVDFNKFSIWKYKSYLYFTNVQRIKTFLFVFLSTVIILTIFYPGNPILLFSVDFIYPSLRVGEYSDEISKSLFNIWHNFVYYIKYFILNRAYHPHDMLLQPVPYPVENIIIFALSLIGIIISLIRKFTYSVIFILYILFMTFFPPLFSETNAHLPFENSSTMHVGRIFYAIPFICIMATLCIRYIYDYIATINYPIRLFFIFLIGVFFCFRIYGYFTEVKRFNTDIESYKISFKQPAKVVMSDFQAQGKIHNNQVYYYQMAKFVSNHLKKINLNSNSMSLLYIPEEIYTPPDDINSSETLYPYYFPMFLTFYLQEEGLNVSYLVKRKDVKETLLRKAITVIDRYKRGENLPDLYPRTRTQEKIVKLFAKIIYWMENYKPAKLWLNSIREQSYLNPKTIIIENYFVNITSSKTPNYLIITNKEELDQILTHSDYELILSLPLL